MTRRARRRAAAWAGLRLLAAAILVAAGTAQASAGGLTPEALWGVTRLSDPQPSPEGSQVAYAARDYSIEKNGSTSRLWLIAADGGAPRPLTLGEVKDSSPRWATPNLLLFLSSRGGSSQIWAIRTDGGEAWQVSDLPLDVANLAVAPGGTSVSFTLEVFPDCEDLDCTANRVKEQEASPVQARVYTELLYRHWDSWEDGRRSHHLGDRRNLEPRIGANRDTMSPVSKPGCVLEQRPAFRPKEGHTAERAACGAVIKPGRQRVGIHAR